MCDGMYCFCIAFLIQNENFNKHACMLIQQRSHISIGSTIIAAAHKNRNSSRMPTWPKVAGRRNYQHFLKWYLSILLRISDLLTISSRTLQSEHYTSSTRGLEVLYKCYNTDVLGILLIYPHSPSGAVMHIYISQTPRGRVITYCIVNLTYE